jgi:hypothetical protein
MGTPCCWGIVRGGTITVSDSPALPPKIVWLDCVDGTGITCSGRRRLLRSDRFLTHVVDIEPAYNHITNKPEKGEQDKQHQVS